MEQSISDTTHQGQAFAGFAEPEENYSKLPHQFIDALPQISSMSELKVVLYILRHTWGYRDDSKLITLDEFQNGRKRKDGTRIDNGVGMTIANIRKGLKSAQEHGFICVKTDDSDKARRKRYYSLNILNENGLIESINQTDQINQSEGLNQSIDQRKKLKKETKERNLADASAPTTPPVEEPPTKIQKPKPDKPTTPKPSKPPTPQQAVFEAVCLAFEYDMAKLTKSEKSRIGKVTAELVAAGYGPQHVPLIHGYCADTFDNFTVNALATSASDAMAAYKDLTGIDPLHEALVLTDEQPEAPPPEEPDSPPVADGVDYFDIREDWDNLDKLIGGG